MFLDHLFLDSFSRFFTLWKLKHQCQRKHLSPAETRTTAYELLVLSVRRPTLTHRPVSDLGKRDY